MIILKILRNPKLAVFAGIFMMLFSCSQYEIGNRTFDYAIYNAFKKGEVEIFRLDFKKKSLELSSEQLLKDVNDYYGTDLKIPIELIDLLSNKNKSKSQETIIEAALKEGWLKQSDIDLADKLFEDIGNKGFDIAIDDCKNEILSMNYTEEEFSKKNIFVNTMEILNDDQPFLFENSTFKNKDTWSCLWAIIVFILAFVSVLACVTWILCGFALYGLALATNDLVDECN
ncbi:MAG: hypothetical protein GW772_09330 [Flavobacteriia bacterium]|nr:hypothetical protein [Flavobacteriia bacterium]OIP46263.1 MAG: hypothetical protein AUK46_08550 [Flavobacteriaceae bacterium CG2_30_31_66]PIV95958.1 MAG: hypothetical protein COW43_10885 [Flavobacteriaceae bacterium CG17_big_fil_post_rev_8_21_14_2_50_31_13]PIX13568.1 MAG: hypothetical protein COZ74_05605 [Flavobacteriaceae bacterium CG_4_8_14_3_um_filter_31_8]PIY16293.1 MAG: hypothetical protein COZ16_00595 [Flavobacteriaceae bacterium CG_4_10_14_3_um_filter_31_253]PIZ11954.1 MAG: hypotheti